MLRTSHLFATLILALGALAFVPRAGHAETAAAPPANLLINGSFDDHELNGSLSCWVPTPPNLSETTSSEDGQPLVTLTSADSRKPVQLEQTVSLRPEWTKVLVRGYIRVTKMDVRGGAGQEPGACVKMTWRATSTSTQTLAAAPIWPAVTNGWAEINQLLTVPTGVDQLIVTPEIKSAVGSVDFKQLSVTAWVMTFDDEFDGKSLDTTKWTPTDSDTILFAPGVQYFAPDHVIIKDGAAIFHADNVAHEAYQWQSGEIRSASKFQQLYGYWECRVKMPVTEGMWPALYLLRYDDAWPPEIDLMEATGRSMDTVYETNHYADDYGVHQASSVNFPSTGLDRSDWHTYAVCWEPGALAWYVDDVYRGTTRTPDARIPDVPMYIRFNLAVGGWGGDPTKTTYPADMLCDWVRVYQRADLPLPLYPGPSIETTLPDNTVILSAIACNPMTGVHASWTLDEGPGAVDIQDPKSLVTKASFDKAGMYRFTVSVAKGASSASHDLLVYVNPPQGKS